MHTPDLLHRFEHLSQARVFVLGDLILDRYTWGNAERISQEAPIIVLKAEEQHCFLGGAANVGHLACGLDALVRCAGVVGNDEAGRALRKMLEESGVSSELVLTDDQRPTTVKERFVGRAAAKHPSQILRVDHEVRESIRHELEETLIQGIERHVTEYDVLLVSDYAKGVCTPRVVRSAIDAAIRHQIPVLVDPARGVDYEVYRGATLLKPNRTETRQATKSEIVQPSDGIDAGRQLCRQLDLDMAVITLDRDGMVLVSQDLKGEAVPTTARSVYDITGAGDMVLAMLGVALGGGADPLTAVHLANLAAGLQVERMGVAVIRPADLHAQLVGHRCSGDSKIVTCEEAAQLAAEHRSRRSKIVFTNGCFDLLHVGHVAVLNAAAQMGDMLVVGLNSDASITRLKGEHRPIVGQAERAAMLSAMACVDLVVIFDEDTPHNLLHAIRPDVLAKGGSYSVDEVIGHDVVQAYGGQVCVTDYVPGRSTTRILETIQERLPAEAA